MFMLMLSLQHMNDASKCKSTILKEDVMGIISNADAMHSTPGPLLIHD